MFELNNRTAFVTGAGTGLGQAAAVALKKATQELLFLINPVKIWKKPRLYARTAVMAIT